MTNSFKLPSNVLKHIKRNNITVAFWSICKLINTENLAHFHYLHWNRGKKISNQKTMKTSIFFFHLESEGVRLHWLCICFSFRVIFSCKTALINDPNVAVHYWQTFWLLLKEEVVFLLDYFGEENEIKHGINSSAKRLKKIRSSEDDDGEKIPHSQALKKERGKIFSPYCGHFSNNW